MSTSELFITVHLGFRLLLLSCIVSISGALTRGCTILTRGLVWLRLHRLCWLSLARRLWESHLLLHLVLLLLLHVELLLFIHLLLVVLLLLLDVVLFVSLLDNSVLLISSELEVDVFRLLDLAVDAFDFELVCVHLSLVVFELGDKLFKLLPAILEIGFVFRQLFSHVRSTLLRQDVL